MDKRLKEVFEQQEKEDTYRITVGMKAAIAEELAGAAEILKKIEYLETLRSQKVSGVADVLQYSVLETFVRVAPEFRIRKHTTCLLPYFHSHDFFEMIYVWHGACCQRIAGKEDLLKLFSGDLCILKPGIAHAMMPCSADDLILKIIIPAPMAKQLADSMEVSTEYLKRESTADSLLHIFRSMPETRGQIRNLMEGLLQETYWGTEFRMAAIRSFLVLLFVLLNRSHAEQTGENLLQEISDYIRRHIKDVSQEELAGELGYSSRQLRRKIAELSGGTFSDILWRIRMEEAAMLLNETEIPVEEVARMVGYRGTAGFYKRFDEMFHMTPAAYRKLYSRYRSF